MVYLISFRFKADLPKGQAEWTKFGGQSKEWNVKILEWSFKSVSDIYLMLKDKYKVLCLKDRNIQSYIFVCKNVKENKLKIMQVDEVKNEVLKKQYFDPYCQLIQSKQQFIVKPEDIFYSPFHFQDVKFEQSLILIYTNSVDQKLIHCLNKLSKKNLIRFVSRIVDGLNSLHAHNIIHKQISSENITLDKKGNPVVANCAIMTKQYTRSQLLQIYNTHQQIYYKSPDIIHKSNFTKESDFWALGIVALELYHGQSIFNLRKNAIPPVPAYDINFPKQYLDNIVEEDIRTFICNLFISQVKSTIISVNKVEKIVHDQKELEFVRTKCFKSQSIISVRGDEVSEALKIINMLKQMQRAELQAIRELIIFDAGLVDLRLITKLPLIKLQTLVLNCNQITDISQVKKWAFEELKSLSFVSNNIVEIDVLADVIYCKKLVQINFFRNKIKKIGVFKIVKFPFMTAVNLSQNEIQDISDLEQIIDHLPLLQIFHLKNNLFDYEGQIKFYVEKYDKRIKF